MQLALDRRLRGMTHQIKGTVTAYDPKTYSVKMQVQPGGQITGWIALQAHHIGNGFGVLMGPNIGDQMSAGFHGGDLESGNVEGRHFDDKHKPPEVQSGEILLKHESGNYLLYKKDKSTTYFHAANKGIWQWRHLITSWI